MTNTYSLLGMASVPHRGINKRLIGYIYSYNDDVDLPSMRSFPKDPIATQEKLVSLLAWATDNLASHKRIISTHSIFPRDYHEGAVSVLSDLIERLNDE